MDQTIPLPQNYYTDKPIWSTGNPQISRFRVLRQIPPYPNGPSQGHLGSHYQLCSFGSFPECASCLEGDYAHLRSCGAATRATIFNHSDEELVNCFNCRRDGHNIFRCPTILQYAVILWHQVLPSSLSWIEFARDLKPGIYEISPAEWAFLEFEQVKQQSAQAPQDLQQQQQQSQQQPGQQLALPQFNPPSQTRTPLVQSQALAREALSQNPHSHPLQA